MILHELDFLKPTVYTNFRVERFNVTRVL